MKIKSAILFSALTITPLGMFAENKAPAEGIITAARLNVRVKPGNSSVAGAFNKGDKIIIQEAQNGWYRIMLPKDASVWIANKFIKDGKVVKSVNLRSGPGINHGTYGIAETGQAITVIDDKTNKEWTKIEPIPTISGWVSAQFVKVEKGGENLTSGQTTTKTAKGTDPAKTDIKELIDQLPKNDPTKKPDPVKPVDTEKTVKKPDPVKPVDTEKTVKKPDPVTLPEENTEELEKQLPFVDEPAEEVTYEGMLCALNPGSVVVTHALSLYEKGQYVPICFLYGRNDELVKNVEQRIKIVGKKHYVKGWKTPVVKVISITVVN